MFHNSWIRTFCETRKYYIKTLQVPVTACSSSSKYTDIKNTIKQGFIFIPNSTGNKEQENQSTSNKRKINFKIFK